MPSRDDLHTYQNDVITYIKEKKRCGIFLEMGLGKTVIVLTAISELKDAGLLKKVLIVAPKRVLISTWVEEIRKWDHLKHLEFGLYFKQEKVNKEHGIRHLKTYKEECFITLLASSGLPYYFKYKRCYANNFDTIIIDESSLFKSGQTIRFNRLKDFIYASGWGKRPVKDNLTYKILF